MKRELLRLSFILLASSLIVFTACKKDKTPPDPTASFTMNNNYMKAPVEVAFTNTSTNATSYLWEINDSIKYTTSAISHTFTTKGWHNIKLTTKNDEGKTANTKNSLRVYGNITSWSPTKVTLFKKAWQEETGTLNIYMSVWTSNNTIYNYTGDNTFVVYEDVSESTSSLNYLISSKMQLAMNNSSKTTIKFQLHNGSGNVNPNIDPIVYQVVLNGSDVLPSEAKGPYKQSFSKDDKVSIELEWKD
jgi:PKD repeat protein